MSVVSTTFRCPPRSRGLDPEWKAAPRVALLAALLVLVPGGCGEKNSPATGCAADLQCPSDYLCMVGVCLPRGMDRTVAVEILPRMDSPAARTDIASVALGPGQVALAADARVTVEGTVTNAPSSHVLLLVQNPIPGEPDLQFETDLANSKFQIQVGSRLLRSMATIWLNPNMEDSDQPPVPFRTMLDSSLTFTFPPAAQMTVIRGMLRTSLNMPAEAYLARALVDTRVVSNVSLTDAAGMYQLSIAPGAIPPEGQQLVTIVFTPRPPDSGPRFQTTPFLLTAATANNAPRPSRMPASLTPAPLRFVVLSDDQEPLPLSDVTMRFRTEISGGDDGVAIYEREARTDADGEVEVLLIPGTATEPRSYQITIVPPPASPYGSKCVPQHPVTMAGNELQPQYSKTFYLSPKVALQGTILSSDRSPAATVSVTATQLSSNSQCASLPSASAVSSTTQRSGHYQMLVDPGTYRLEVDPPMGSPVPRLIQDGEQAVVVTADPVTTHDVVLPLGEVIEGDVTGADDLPLVSASLKIYQVLCDGESCLGPDRIAPALRAQTRTDMNGHFRAVLPLP